MVLEDPDTLCRLLFKARVEHNAQSTRDWSLLGDELSIALGARRSASIVAGSWLLICEKTGRICNIYVYTRPVWWYTAHFLSKTVGPLTVAL